MKDEGSTSFQCSALECRMEALPPQTSGRAAWIGFPGRAWEPDQLDQFDQLFNYA
jgi:hypothetical protein